MNSDDDVDAWLATMADEPVADDGFSAAVMRRVQHEAAPARGTAESIAPPSALALLERRSRASARQSRWRWGGLGVGAALAGAMLAPQGLAAPALQPMQWFALAVAVAVTAAVLAAPET